MHALRIAASFSEKEGPFSQRPLQYFGNGRRKKNPSSLMFCCVCLCSQNVKHGKSDRAELGDAWWNLSSFFEHV